MSLNCMTCKIEIDYLNPEQSDITGNTVDGGWLVDVILSCPCCGQKYNAFIPADDFDLLTEDSRDGCGDEDE
ncbi:hypothetical protein BIY29_07490 [Brenneria alni]|uniref:Uncharacterized protein n=1 Tax=Brenneria alni TaxID=71656 RepID=A0A421DQ70_9GAMM|nr:hypothetical protein [Brenneria alni]RLM25346.1 hypothetical protein BIY29_07490 [Brenneria alni]